MTTPTNRLLGVVLTTTHDLKHAGKKNVMHACFIAYELHAGLMQAVPIEQEQDQWLNKVTSIHVTTSYCC